MFILGITGPTGSGKTTVLDTIQQYGGYIIDCDKVYKDLLKTDKNLIAKIEDTFGRCRDANNNFNTRELWLKIAKDINKLNQLNNITHPVIVSQVKNIIDNLDKDFNNIVAIDAFALFESGLDKICNTTLAVVAPTWIRIKRIMIRDNITEKYAISRIESQKSNEYYIEKCEYTIYNQGTAEELKAKATEFVNNLFKIVQGS